MRSWTDLDCKGVGGDFPGSCRDPKDLELAGGVVVRVESRGNWEACRSEEPGHAGCAVGEVWCLSSGAGSLWRIADGEGKRGVRC